MFQAGRRLVWIYMMARKELGSDGESLWGLRILVRLLEVGDEGDFGGNHDRVCIVFGQCGGIVLNLVVMAIGGEILTVDGVDAALAMDRILG